MIIYWPVHYLDRTDEQRRSRERQYQDRRLFLDTDTLDPVTKAAVEFLVETKTKKTEREILKFRDRFQELKPGESFPRGGEHRSVLLIGYIEDENGKELTEREVAFLLTGTHDAVRVPAQAEQHDIEYMFSQPVPMPVAEVVLSPDEVKTLGYFCRDLQELSASSFFNEGCPASLKSGYGVPSGTSVLETAVSDEEIRSHVTIYRRLYMKNEPANFVTAVDVFTKAIGDHPRAKWVAGAAKSYEAKMEIKPHFCNLGPFNKCTFTRKRLIDVFLYTQYAHQPNDKNSKPAQQREQQFNECLKEAGESSVLTWLFLSELWFASHELKCAGVVVADWFDRFCKHHNLTPAILESLLIEHPGIGTIEKESVKRTRILGEKTRELAVELWKKNGSPPSGPVHYLHDAYEQLTGAITGV